MKPSITFPRLSQTLCLLLLLLSLATPIIFFFLPPYKASDKYALDSPSFNVLNTSWKHSHSGRFSEVNSGIRLISSDSQNHVYISSLVPVSPTINYVMFSCLFLTENILSKHGKDHHVRIAVISYDQKKRPLWHLPHTVVITDHDGSTPWNTVNKVFRIHPNIAYMRILCEVKHVEGSLSVKDIKLQLLSDNDAFDLVTQCLLYIWFSVILLSVGMIIFCSKWNIAHAVFLAIGVLILAGVLLPKKNLSTIQGKMEQKVVSVRKDKIQKTGEANPAHIKFLLPWLTIRKIAHFVLFGCLVIACYRAKPTLSLLQINGYIFLYVLVTEALQFYSEGRTPQFLDICIDGAGMMAASLYTASCPPVGSIFRRNAS